MLASISSFGGPDIWLRFGTCVALGVGFAVVFCYVSRRRGLRLIEEWARLHEITIVSIRQPVIVTLWRSSRGWQFFRAKLRDSAGTLRECWIRCPVLAFVCFGRTVDFVEVIDAKPQGDSIWMVTQSPNKAAAGQRRSSFA